MEEQQNANQSQTAKKPDKGALIIIGIIVAVILAVIIYFVVTSGNKGGNAVQPPADMGELRDVTPANLYGLWDKEIEAGTAQLDFKTDKTLVYKEMDKDGNVTAQSETGTFETQDGKLILTISAYGDTYSDLCTAYLSLDTLVISADEGTGFFNGTYKSESEIPDELYDYFNSETESDTTEQPPVTDQQEVTTPETDAPVTEAPVTEAPATEAPATETPDSQEQAQGEVHIPEIIGLLFLEDADTYFNGNVPSVDNDAMGWASFNVREDHMSLTINYARDYSQERVTPTGTPVEIIAYVEDLFPQLENTSYDSLQALLGDSISCEYHEMTGSYYITAQVDGYQLTFNGGETVSLDEIETCSIRLPE